MSICDYCNGEVALPFTCKRCGKLFCPEHKLPESHDCELLKKFRSPQITEEKKEVSCTNCGGKGWVKVTSHQRKTVEYRKCPRCTANWIPTKKPDKIITPIYPKREVGEKKSNIPRKIKSLTDAIRGIGEFIIGMIVVGIFLLIFLIITPLQSIPFAILFSVLPPNELTVEQAVFELTNEERQKAGIHPLLGVSPLSYNEDLHLVAKEHSKDMVERGYFSHYSPEGLSPTDRARIRNITVIKYLGTSGNTKYYAEGIAENIIEVPLGFYRMVSFKNPDEGGTTPTELSCFLVLTSKQIAKCAVEGWKDSPGHYKNIVNPDYDEIGVGVYCRNDKCRITQNFR